MALVHGSLSTPRVARPLRRLICLAILAIFVVDTSASAQTPNLKPIYWRQRLFFIPYQVNKRDLMATQVTKVQLLMSHDGASDWRPLQEATPEVRGFAYHAAEDGEFWFALRHLDRQGQPWPSAAVQPQMRIIVDTALPELELTGSVNAAGKLAVRYESRDSNLRPESLIIEARLPGETWSSVPLGPPDVSHPDHMVGRAEWALPYNATTVEIRGSIADQAGHRGQASTEVLVAGPSLQSPAKSANPAKAQNGWMTGLATPSQERITTDPFQTTAKMPSQDWPANNRLPQTMNSDSLAAKSNQLEAPAAQKVGTPPLQNPYTMGGPSGDESRTPAKLVADEKMQASDSLFGSPPLGNNAWSSPGSLSQNLAVRTVNSRTFDVEYDLQSVGPWGVSRVELWGTHDDGKTWQSYGVDSDNRSPVRATVPGTGVYGFRILVDGANGVRATPPRSGEQPELIVAVDLSPPAAEITSANIGEGNLAGHLLLSWSADDTNLEPRPIGLFYSAYPNGPWSTIAAGLENTGTYTWRMERHLPDRFFVRMEARDIAGNLATYQLPEPITLDRPRPTGHLRSVRPVETERDY